MDGKERDKSWILDYYLKQCSLRIPSLLRWLYNVDLESLARGWGMSRWVIYLAKCGSAVAVQWSPACSSSRRRGVRNKTMWNLPLYYTFLPLDPQQPSTQSKQAPIGGRPLASDHKCTTRRIPCRNSTSLFSLQPTNHHLSAIYEEVANAVESHPASQPARRTDGRGMHHQTCLHLPLLLVHSTDLPVSALFPIEVFLFVQILLCDVLRAF